MSAEDANCIETSRPRSTENDCAQAQSAQSSRERVRMQVMTRPYTDQWKPRTEHDKPWVEGVRSISFPFYGQLFADEELNCKEYQRTSHIQI